MKRRELQSEFDRLDYQIRIVRDAVGDAPDEIVALASQNVCVAICASLEYSLKAIFTGYARHRTDNQIYRPIERLCQSYQNPKTTKILELVSLFDKDFGEGLAAEWDDDSSLERDHINNLVEDRISIAHRKKVHSNIGAGKLRAYYSAYESLLTRVHEHFFPNG